MNAQSGRFAAITTSSMPPDHRRRPFRVLTLGVANLLLACVGGCGDSSEPNAPVVDTRPTTPTQPAATAPPSTQPPATRPPASSSGSSTGAPNGSGTQPTKASEPADVAANKKPRGPRTLADLVPEALRQDPAGNNEAGKGFNAPMIAARKPIDPDRAQAAGLRKIDGRHLTLYTDLPADPEVDGLPAAFDAAVPLWCGYFNVDPPKAADWRLTGYVMKDDARFRQCGALPDDLPKFRDGYSHGWEFWVREQPSAYYRRHLVLHEGTHAFMNHWLGGMGPPWYAEGLAELFATHRWENGRLTVGYLPRANTDVPEWGRIKIIQNDYAQGNGKTLEEIFQYGLDAHLQVEPYAWCWAAVMFLQYHPRTKAAFRELQANVRDGGPEFSRSLMVALQDEWEHLREEWQMFVVQADYGYDVRRAAVEWRDERPLPPEGVTVKIETDRGWQSTGWRLEANRTYRITASGRFYVTGAPTKWPCEPGGVTIQYYQTRPLGQLLGAVRGAPPPPGELSPLSKPFDIGLGRLLTPETTGALFLRINERSIDLADNTGQVEVRIEPQ